MTGSRWPVRWDAFLELGGCSAVASFERRYDAVLSSLPVTSLCEYDLAIWGPDTLIELMDSHPILALEGNLYENIFYEGPGERADKAKASRS